MIKRAVAIVVLLAGCTGEKPEPVASGPPATQSVQAPFEYRITKTDETPHTMGPQVVVRLQTTNEIARAATQDDLRELWQHLSPTLGDRRIFIQLDTGVPGASLWGLITRLNLTGKWEVKVEKFETGIDAEPYNFVDKIDRKKPNQQAMILTLPVVNKIIERLKQAGWTQTYGSEDLVKLELPASGMESFDVTLSPEGITVQGYQKDESELFDVIVLLTEEVGIGNEIKSKMQSVIGSPEYFRGNGENHNGYSAWHWRIGAYDVSYRHREPDFDDIDIGFGFDAR
jgi:hypothetical protein